jgi:hypothetical protein
VASLKVVSEQLDFNVFNRSSHRHADFLDTAFNPMEKHDTPGLKEVVTEASQSTDPFGQLDFRVFNKTKWLGNRMLSFETLAQSDVIKTVEVAVKVVLNG